MFLSADLWQQPAEAPQYAFCAAAVTLLQIKLDLKWNPTDTLVPAVVG